MKFIIYGKFGCKWCDEAAILLNCHDVEYEERCAVTELAKEVNPISPLKNKGVLKTKDGNITLPIIFKIDKFGVGEYLGGYEELETLFKSFYNE